MKTNIIAAATATSIALTSVSATTAQATVEEDILTALAVTAAIALVVNAINNPAPAPAPAPVTFSTGPIKIPQTWAFDLDHGNLGGGANSDLWFQAVTPVKLFLKPRNGAKMAVGDRSNRGFAGCSVASYSGARVPIWTLPVGSYVCVKTSQGRISQFRVNKLTAGSPKKLKIGYTTWQ